MGSVDTAKQLLRLVGSTRKCPALQRSRQLPVAGQRGGQGSKRLTMGGQCKWLFCGLYRATVAVASSATSRPPRGSHADAFYVREAHTTLVGEESPIWVMGALFSLSRCHHSPHSDKYLDGTKPGPDASMQAKHVHSWFHGPMARHGLVSRSDRTFLGSWAHSKTQHQVSAGVNHSAAPGIVCRANAGRLEPNRKLQCTSANLV